MSGNNQTKPLNVKLIKKHDILIYVWEGCFHDCPPSLFHKVGDCPFEKEIYSLQDVYLLKEGKMCLIYT